MNAITTRNGTHSVSQRPQLPEALAGAFQVLHVGTGFRATPEQEKAFALILGGYSGDVLRFAALEYVRQRKVAPQNPGELGQLAGWLQRAIEDARPKYTSRERRAEPDTFVAQFVAACGNDTRAFIAAQANAPHAVVDVDDDDRADLLRRIELTRKRIASGGFVDADYGRDYLAHLEAQL